MRKTGKFITCIFCGAAKYMRGCYLKRGGKYCSIECRDNHKRSHRHDPKTCIRCGSLFKSTSKSQRFCSYRCSKVGSLNPNFRKYGSLNNNWRGGLAPDRTKNGNGRKWMLLSRLIRMRDRACKLCGAHGFLEVHHIIPVSQNPDLEFDKGNLICLCVTCHRKLYRKENEWAHILRRLIYA